MHQICKNAIFLHLVAKARAKKNAVVYNSCRNRRKLKREALLKPKFSAWNRLYCKGDDGSFLELTGFNKKTFKLLLKDLFDEEPVRAKVGRPRMLDNAAKLGLYLLYLNSTVALKHLCLIFGVVPSTASSALSEMRERVCEKLLTNRAARVKFPNKKQMKRYAWMIQQ